MTGDGKVVEVGLAEITSALSLYSAACVVTLAARNGIVPDFVTRVAMALTLPMKEDPHGLCLPTKILMEASLILQGQKILMDERGLLHTDMGRQDGIDLLKGCSPHVEQPPCCRDRQKMLEALEDLTNQMGPTFEVVEAHCGLIVAGCWKTARTIVESAE